MKQLQIAFRSDLPAPASALRYYPTFWFHTGHLAHFGGGNSGLCHVHCWVRPGRKEENSLESSQGRHHTARGGEEGSPRRAAPTGPEGRCLGERQSHLRFSSWRLCRSPRPRPRGFLGAAPTPRTGLGGVQPTSFSSRTCPWPSRGRVAQGGRGGAARSRWSRPWWWRCVSCCW